MATLRQLGRGLAVAGSTLALTTTVAFSTNVSSAQALTGVLNITGAANFLNGGSADPGADRIDFLNGTVAAATTNGDFNIYDGLSATLSSINLTRTSLGIYQGTTVSNPFITIAPDLTFVADNPFTVTRTPDAFGFVNYVAGLTGQFINGAGMVLGAGTVTGNTFNSDGSYSMTFVARSVPEPTSALGTIAALGIGAFFAKKLVKKEVTLDA